jgi:hypothetical protein
MPGGCSTGIFPGDKKGMDSKNGLGSARDIFDRGGRDSDPGVWVSGLVLTVPLFPGLGQGIGAGRRRHPGRCAGAGALGAGQQGQHDKGIPSPLPAYLWA